MGAIAAVAVGIVAAAAAGIIQPPKAPTASDDNRPMVMHIHPKLSILVDGKPMTIPENIGIDPALYNDHTLDTYGMKMPDMPSMPVMYPTHTHDSTGTIHVESNVNRDYTLRDFLSVWGMQFSGKTLELFVDGTPVPSNIDPRSHVFKDGEQIILEVQ